LALIDQLIGSMQLIDRENDNCQMFKPNRLFNPAYQRLSQCVLHRFLHPGDAELPPIDPQILDEIVPPPALISQLEQSSLLGQLKSAFPLAIVQPPEKKRRRFKQDRVEMESSKPISLDDLIGFASNEPPAVVSLEQMKPDFPVSSKQPTASNSSELQQPSQKPLAVVAAVEVQPPASRLTADSRFANNEHLMEFIETLDQPGDHVTEGMEYLSRFVNNRFTVSKYCERFAPVKMRPKHSTD
jgi:hypothetical protein